MSSEAALRLTLGRDRQPLVELLLRDLGIPDLGDGARWDVVAAGDEGKGAGQGERKQQFQGGPCQSGGEG